MWTECVVIKKKQTCFVGTGLGRRTVDSICCTDTKADHRVQALHVDEAEEVPRIILADHISHDQTWKA